MEGYHRNVEIKDPPEKILIRMPPGLISKLDEQAEKEERTRSEMVREAIRYYLTAKTKEQ